MSRNLARVPHVDRTNQDQPRFRALHLLDRVKHLQRTLVIDFFSPLWSTFSTSTRREDDDIGVGERLSEGGDGIVFKGEDERC